MKRASLNACLLVAVAAPAIFCTAGCSRGSSSGAVASEIATLDQAYRAGVLTKAEYEAKKTGVESQAPALEALEQAVAAGVVSRGDYPAMKARLIAKGIGLAALEQGHKAGVFSDQEYATRKAALTATPVPSAPGAPAAAPDVGSSSVTAVAVSGAAPVTSVPAPTTAVAPAVVPATTSPTRTAAAAAPAARAPSGAAPGECEGYKDQNNFLHNLGLCDHQNVEETPADKKDRHVLPSWVPMYPGATSTATDTFQDNGHAVYSQNFQTSGPVSYQTVVDFYRTRLTGFKTTESHMNSFSGGFRMENAKYEISLGVMLFPGESSPMISVSVKEK